MRALFLLFLAAFALAQAPKPLKVGELTLSLTHISEPTRPY